MRITQGIMIDRTLRNLRSTYAEIIKKQNQMSSGKKFETPSQDPVGTIYSMRYNADKTEITQYIRNLAGAKNWLRSNDAALDQVGNILTRIKELAVRGASDTLNQSDRNAIAIEVNSLLEQLVYMANGRQADKSLFAGQATEKNAFIALRGLSAELMSLPGAEPDWISNVEYNGDLASINIHVTNDNSLKINEHGEEVFFNISTQKVFSTVYFSDPDRVVSDVLHEGYFTIVGRDREETIKIFAGDTVRDIVARISKESSLVSAYLKKEANGYRVVFESREQGKNNQFSLIEGGYSSPRPSTNLLSILGMVSEARSSVSIANPSARLSFYIPEMSPGNFFINGTPVDIDPSKDSLQDIVFKINSKKQDFRARIEDGRLVISSTGTLNIQDGTFAISRRLGFPLNRIQGSHYFPSATVGPRTLNRNEWIKDGAFKLNGSTVQLKADRDTLYSLADRINSMSLGVTAAVAGDQFVLQAPPGSRISSLLDGQSQFVKTMRFSMGSEPLSPALLGGATLQSQGISGQFMVGGMIFTVDSGDTIDTVLTKINSAKLGVRAFIDSSGAFVLEPFGVEDNISSEIFSDVSGGNFFSSINFASWARSDPRVTAQLVEAPLAADGISSGEIRINGQAVVINAQTDSLSDIVRKINSLGSGITAYVNASNQLVIDSALPVSIMDSTVRYSDSLGTGIDPATTLMSAVGVTAGDVLINGRTLTVSAADTISDFLYKVNSLGAGVQATFDQVSGRIKLATDNPAFSELLFETPAGGSNLVSVLNLQAVSNTVKTNFVARCGMERINIRSEKGDLRIQKSDEKSLSLFDYVIKLRDSLVTGNVDAVSESVKDLFSSQNSFPSIMQRLDDSLAHILEVRARFGAKENRVDLEDRRFRSISNFLDKLIAETEDVDIERVFIELTSLEATYEASLKAAARIFQPSLLDFLR